MTPVRVFIGCAKEDQSFVSELLHHLAVPCRQGLLEPWHQGMVVPGAEPQAERSLHIQKAQILLLLVTSDYLGSDPGWAQIERALRMQEQGLGRVLPVLLRPVALAGSPLSSLQLLPRGGPLSLARDRDQAWTEVVEAVTLAARAAAPPKGPPPAPEATPPGPPAGAPADDLLPGATIGGKFQVVREIGRGGMGRVLLATRTDAIGGQVALKVLLPEFSRNAQVVHRFFNEARSVNEVGHPGLVKVFDHGQLADGSTYLVMEYLDGESLGQRLRGDPLSLRRKARFLGWQVASILARVHERGIVHRDLKPDNVVLVPDPGAPGGERVKVLDFGIAKMAREHSRIEGTRQGAILGTPAYMAPEQCRDSASVTPMADVYALGVLLYQCLSGQVPFSDPDYLVVMSRHLNEAPRPLAGLSGESQTASLTMRMLDKDPLRRPSMAQVAAALVPEAPADPQAPPETTPAGPSRRRLLLGLSALLAGTVGLTGFVYTVMKDPHRPGLLVPAAPNGPDLARREKPLYDEADLRTSAERPLYEDWGPGK